jgi:hypothetical protein
MVKMIALVKRKQLLLREKSTCSGVAAGHKKDGIATKCAPQESRRGYRA